MIDKEKNQKIDETPMGYDVLLGAANSLREKLYKAIELDKEVKHSLQYRDYPEGGWTLPCKYSIIGLRIFTRIYH